MSNMPIYSQVAPKYRAKNAKGNSTRENRGNPREFDPLNYNHGGNIQLLNAPMESRIEKLEKRESRRKEETRVRRTQNRSDANEGKVEAYLRQNQVSIRQQQNRHSAVRHAEHRVNLRSLPLNEITSRQERTPTGHRVFPEREVSRDSRRQRDRERDFDFDGSPLSPIARDKDRVKKSSTRVSDVSDKRRFFCREWVFQKIAHCLEQRAVSKTAGTLILGDAGSGKTALCQELSAPGTGPQARQQRALNRRMLARHFLQGPGDCSQRPGEFVRSLAMQILSHSEHAKPDDRSDRNSLEENFVQRFRDMGEDCEESSKPLLADSEDQRTDEEETSSRQRTADRLHEREEYTDCINDAELSGHMLPEILPKADVKPTNPFVSDQNDLRLYENHENLFLRNISQRQSKELRNSRLLRQSSEPLQEKRPSVLQKSLSNDQEEKKEMNSPPKSRIPVANFRYPNKSGLRPDSSPKKDPKELPEYQNIVHDVKDDPQTEMELLLEKKRSASEEEPPPIPSLPVNPRTLIANAYYEKLLSETEIQQALLPQNLDKNPDECFKKAILFPLLEIDPPKQCLFLLIDAIDEGATNDGDGSEGSVAGVVGRHQHLLPHWLLLVATARRHSRLARVFTGFRKITLDELCRAHVAADVQRYVLARLDNEPRLRARVSSDAAAAASAAAALDHLRIKSDGCLLYLEKVLDGVADGFIALREIREIPGTLNGLYLWLAQRLFHGRRFNKVRLVLDVLLAARCGVTEDMLYKCLLTKEYSVTREDFNRRMHLLRRIVSVDRSTGFVAIFHRSFSSWLVDVKHCTRRYLCDVSAGHAALAMHYTLEARRLSALEIHHYVYHMTQLEQHLASLKKGKLGCEPVELHTLVLLWVLDSGCQVEAALQHDRGQIEEKIEDKDQDPESEGKESTSCKSLEQSALENIMPELVNGSTPRWPRDRRVMRALMELSRTDSVPTEPEEDVNDLLSTEKALESEENATGDEHDEALLLDPGTVHELAARGDEDALSVLLKRRPELAQSVDAAGATALHAARAAAWAGHVEYYSASDSVPGNVEVVRQLLDRGLDEHHRDNSGWTPLHYAAFEGHIEVCEALLEAGAKVDEADNDGKGPLMLAAQEGHTRLLELLVDTWAAPVDQRAHDGKTALRLAALEGHFEAVAALHCRGADVDALDADRRSTLYVLALDNRLAMARQLLACGASVHSSDTEGRTPLHVSAWQGHTEMVNLLIKVGGASVDGRDRCSRTALHAAAWRGRAGVLRTLLEHGADPAAVCTQGATPLGKLTDTAYTYILSNKINICRICDNIIGGGADPLQADHCGRTPAKVAWRAGHANICRLLERWTAPSAPPAPPVTHHEDKRPASPEYKRRSIHSSNSTKSSSNMTGGSNRSHDEDDKGSLSFAQQVARCGRARREIERDEPIPEHQVLEQDSKLRSYIANERDSELHGYARERDRRREQRHGTTSPLYASPPRSPSEPRSPDPPAGSQPASLTSAPALTDNHFNRDTHMRIILGRDKHAEKHDGKNKRNGIVTNPAMRLVANVRNGLDSAAANIRRTGVALAASASSSNPAVKTNAFQWRKETPL
nr:ankyrin repeat domain-containing protein 50 [Danaus plexippus plexippus]